MGEWTLAKWKAVSKAANVRCLDCGRWPRPDTRWALLALLRRRGEGEPWPSAFELSRSCGASVDTVRERIYPELMANGFVCLLRRGEGQRPHEFALLGPQILAWVSGEIEAVPFVLENSGTVVAENSGATRGVVPENPGTPSRARGPVVVVEATLAERIAEERARRDEVFATMMRSFKSTYGTRILFGMKSRVMVWMDRGMELDDFRHAAEEAMTHGERAQNWAYMDSVLQAQWAKGSAAPGGEDGHPNQGPGPVEMSEYRAARGVM